MTGWQPIRLSPGWRSTDTLDLRVWAAPGVLRCPAPRGAWTCGSPRPYAEHTHWVIEWVQDHPGITAEQISMATGMSVALIHHIADDAQLKQTANRSLIGRVDREPVDHETEHR